MSAEELVSSAYDLTKFGAVAGAEAASSAFARLLILGDAKRGKSTAVLEGAPGPIVVLNGDGDSALKWPLKDPAIAEKIVGIFDVDTVKQFKHAVTHICKAAEAGAVKSIAVDSLSLLADNLYDDICLAYSESRERYGTLLDTLSAGVKKLLRCPAHVFIVAHMIAETRESDGQEGHVPLVRGQFKVKAAALAHDIVMFDYSEARKPERQFLIGPQAGWHYGSRSMKRTCAIPADVKLLFEELGITP